MAELPDPVAELKEAMAPFVAGHAPGISQSLYKALYQLQTANRHGLDGPGEEERAIARLASMNPERLRIPETPVGRRLRAALRSANNRHTKA
ncbi:hypothetical protein OHB13_37530 (plasmid) [Streptomyces sp. NBC_00440]|uniref:hypothetical protein n=1 Tax=Streptomyces sp. NBC_00440 TaxID=2975741 RepID=UPI002E1E87B1